VKDTQTTIETKYLDLAFDVKEISDEGKFEGYASTHYNVDRGGDRVEQGAFDRSLARYKARNQRPKMLWQHDPTKVIGVWDDMYQDDKGLYVKGRLLKETQLGKEAHVLMRAGAIDSMSIGYRTLDADYEGDDAEVRVLKELDLFEVSVVTFPMNPDAIITAVKRIDSIRDVERLLRDGGVPNSMAKLIASHGFNEAVKRIDGQRDAATTDSEAYTRLMKSLRDRKGITNVT
jgi:HK97 family phage prohead protease